MQQQSNSLKEMWGRCLVFIQDNVSEEVFSTWFEPIVPLSYEEGVLTVQVPSMFFCEYLEEKFCGIIGEGISKIFGIGTKLNYYAIVDQKTSAGFAVEASNDFGQSNISKNEKVILPTSIDPFCRYVEEDLDPQLNTSYSFKNLIEGDTNKLARAAGETIAQRPGDNPFNPLFVYGGSGVGKTHLLHAIGLKVKEDDPRKRVLYVSAHLFQLQYTDATLDKKVNDFIHFYQSIDVLLIDDIQELAGKEKTQNAFFHIFNHLHQTGKQLVMSSDKSPAELEGMADRLLTRFKWGLTAEIEYPNLELRKAILRHHIAKDGLLIGEDVVDYVAERITASARDLEGAIVSLLAHSTIYNKEIDLELAQKVLDKRANYRAKEITLESIQEKVCDFYKIDAAALLGKSRKREVATARQVSMYLTKKNTSLTLQTIGNYFGKRDHATVLHACKTVREWITIDKTFREELMELEDKIKG